MVKLGFDAKEKFSDFGMLWFFMIILVLVFLLSRSHG